MPAGVFLSVSIYHKDRISKWVWWLEIFIDFDILIGSFRKAHFELSRIELEILL